MLNKKEITATKKEPTTRQTHIHTKNNTQTHRQRHRHDHTHQQTDTQGTGEKHRNTHTEEMNEGTKGRGKAQERNTESSKKTETRRLEPPSFNRKTPSLETQGLDTEASTLRPAPPLSHEAMIRDTCATTSHKAFSPSTLCARSPTFVFSRLPWSPSWGVVVKLLLFFFGSAARPLPPLPAGMRLRNQRVWSNTLSNQL